MLSRLGEYKYEKSPVTTNNAILGPYKYENGATYIGNYYFGNRHGNGSLFYLRHIDI